MIRLCAFADEASVDLEGQIDALVRNGISLLEIRGVDGKNVTELNDGEVDRYRRRLADHGISVWSIGSPIGKVGINVDFAGYRKKVIRTCEIANRFGCENIRMFSFFHAYEAREKVMHYLRQTVQIGARYGVHMCHENEKDIYGDTLLRVEDILENVPGLCSVFDPANFVQAGEDTALALDRLAKKSRYFHIKDVIRETGEIVPAGEGDGNIPRLVSMLEGDMVLTVEPHLAVFDGYAKIDGTQLKNKYRFVSNGEAFDAAVRAMKNLLRQNQYQEKDGGFCK